MSSTIGDVLTPPLPAPSPVINAPSASGGAPSPIVNTPAPSVNTPPPTDRASSPVVPSAGVTSPTGPASNVNPPANGMHIEDVGDESISVSPAVDAMQVDSVPTDGNHVGPVPSTSTVIPGATTSVAEVDNDPPMFGPLTEEHWIGVQQGRLLAPWDPIPAFDDNLDRGMEGMWLVFPLLLVLCTMYYHFLELCSTPSLERFSTPPLAAFPP